MATTPHISDRFVYALIDPRTQEPRYVGQCYCLKYRLEGHLCAKGTNKKDAWVRELKAQSLRPVVMVLATVNARGHQDNSSVLAEARCLERQWITTLLNEGVHLLNKHHIPPYPIGPRRPVGRPRKAVA